MICHKYIRVIMLSGILLLNPVSSSLFAQAYVDILKIGFDQSFKNKIKDHNESTHIASMEVDLTFPVVLGKDRALITGLLFSRDRLQLYADGTETTPFSSLYSTTLKLGFSTPLDERWNLTVIILPKLASQYGTISARDLYVGGVALAKFKKKENLFYRFGWYTTSEAYGLYMTPILGGYYISQNGKLEIDLSLPISGDLNYTSGGLTYGLDFTGIGRSFLLNKSASKEYVHLDAVEFASYVQINAFDKNILLRLKLGYAANDYEVYAEGDKTDLGFLAFQIGDDRQQLNPDIGGGLFFKVQAIYRIHL
jgi:hypothetical protein